MGIVQQHQVKKEKTYILTYFTFMVRISQLDVLRLLEICLWIKLLILTGFHIRIDGSLASLPCLAGC